MQTEYLLDTYPEMKRGRLWRHRNWIASREPNKTHVKVAAEPIHYLSRGRWKEINTALARNGTGWHVPHLPAFFGDSGLIHTQKTISHLRRYGVLNGGFRPLGAFGQGRAKANTFFLGSKDYEALYTVSKRGIKEEIVIPAVPAIDEDYLVFEYFLKGDLSACAPSFLVDANGELLICDRIQEGDKTYVLVPMDWLNSAAFPVILDPDVTVSDSCNISVQSRYGYTWTHDTDNPTYISANDSTGGGVGQGWCYSCCGGLSGLQCWYFYRSNVIFDLTGISGTLTSAYMTVYSAASPAVNQFDSNIGIFQPTSLSGCAACTFFIGTGGPCHNAACRNGSLDTILANTSDFNSSPSSPFDSPSLITSYIQSAINSASKELYYCFKTMDDHNSVDYTPPGWTGPPPSVQQGTAGFNIFDNGIPGIVLHLTFPGAAGIVFGTILG